MNVGDLVTLSSRGSELESCRTWRRFNRSSPNPVGLIVEIFDPKWDWDKNRKYVIQWISGGPRSRETMGYYHGRKTGHWHRSDLKWVAKAK